MVAKIDSTNKINKKKIIREYLLTAHCRATEVVGTKVCVGTHRGYFNVLHGVGETKAKQYNQKKLGSLGPNRKHFEIHTLCHFIGEWLKGGIDVDSRRNKVFVYESFDVALQLCAEFTIKLI